MKKCIKLLVVLFIGLLVVTGCESTKKKVVDTTIETNKKTSSNPLVGKWEYENEGFIYTFNKNMTGVYDLGDSKKEFSYEIKDDKLSILYEDTTATFDTTFKIEGDTLILKDSLDNDVKYIKK